MASTTGETSKAKKPTPNNEPRPITSVYITGLPDDTTISEVARYFEKCGIILLDDTGIHSPLSLPSLCKE